MIKPLPVALRIVDTTKSLERFMLGTDTLKIFFTQKPYRVIQLNYQ